MTLNLLRSCFTHNHKALTLIFAVIVKFTYCANYNFDVFHFTSSMSFNIVTQSTEEFRNYAYALATLYQLTLNADHTPALTGLALWHGPLVASLSLYTAEFVYRIPKYTVKLTDCCYTAWYGAALTTARSRVRIPPPLYTNANSACHLFWVGQWVTAKAEE